MKKSNFAYSMLAVVLSTAVMSGSALAATTTDSAGAKIDSSMKKVDSYMGDSAVTAKVKSALIDDKAIKSNDISVKTDNGVVTLSGFVGSQAEGEQAVAVATKVEGVKSVSDKLHTKDSKEQSAKGYAGDTATTTSVKAKLLADDIVPSRMVKVETTDGVVQLSGSVKDQAQADRAESVAKTVDGVKSVKNDLKIAP
ncbi:MAG: molecular chaperone OsmY [Ewingella americana]|jgi:hyperosmotically inducible protein|uniref:Osmotically-inducible protein Y n=2 Tax=Ewingella americana TaxID=41202 RepID=A0A085GPR5_EWIA3|nr:molecular chaperone OsmY [Ewingella americana]MDN5679395.1 molecular chaperone OsmY [Ewingella sp.]NWA36681.1 molecular chaperone OsmY [Pseudomonas reactans]KAA8728112.1 molecular chaperone OsmY [Ewingella americana]KFC85710.1 osmotically-inducible protein [Ewingella americana ATCC 33852]MCI1680874.1 molecular chaperone OsmY [Ewingella americana]